MQAYTGVMTINRTYDSQLANSNTLQYQVLSFATVQAVSNYHDTILFLANKSTKLNLNYIQKLKLIIKYHWPR